MNAFWTVCREGEVLMATHRHPNKLLAMQEAMRLAEKEKGVRFFVMRCRGMMIAPEGKRTATYTPIQRDGRPKGEEPVEVFAL